MPTNDDNFAGTLEDRVRLRFTNEAGETNDIPIIESYEVGKAILTQPSTFSARIGWGGVTRDLLDVLVPGLRFDLLIGDVPQFTGFLDGYEAEGSVGATEITIHGRDTLARLHDAFVVNEVTVANQTYAQIVQREIDATYGTGEDAPPLFFTNDANRSLTTGVGVKVNADPDADPTQKSSGPTARQMQAHIGERRYEYLQRQLQRAGLFLWAGGGGELVLTAPNGNQRPVARILRRRGQTRDAVSVLTARLRNDTSGRFSEAVVHAHGGGRKSGRTKLHGSFVDEEMVAYGITRPLVLVDTNVTNATMAAFYARRKLAETRRQGWSLTYVVAGHTCPAIGGVGRAVWQPDTCIEIIDDEFGLNDTYYLERCAYRRNPATTTELTFMRRGDLIFGGGES